jgi:phosphate transport system substrate-binding protein
MYTNGNPQGIVKEFIDFVLSDEGQKLVEANGYVGLK